MLGFVLFIVCCVLCCVVLKESDSAERKEVEGEEGEGSLNILRSFSVLSLVRCSEVQ